MSSSSDADPVAITALVVSLIALFTTMGQLLQQYFATADGYRRCQSSVMGDWAECTHRRWHWRQFRFETLYTTPEISIVGMGTPDYDNKVLILGDRTSRKLTLTPPAVIWDQFTQSDARFPLGLKSDSETGHTGTGDSRNRMTSIHSGKLAAVLSLKKPHAVALPDPLYNHTDELVSWLPLLHWFHEVTRASFEGVELPEPRDASDTTPETLLTWRRYPALVMQERSWDFQPSDVIRPLAKTTVSTIAIMARRMGMRWKDFRPDDGILRAEGHSHIITSTIVRSLCLVLQYNYTGRSKRLARQSPWRATVPGSVYKEEEEI